VENIRLLEGSLLEMGASKFAYAEVGRYLPDELKGLDYAISVAVRLSDAVINQIDVRPNHTYFHHYRSVNALIDNITLRTMLLIQEWGYPALAIPASQTVKSSVDMYAGVFQHKTAAVLGGMGWIGKNALLVTPEYGPRVRLGTVLTSMELPVKADINASQCGDCRLP
jgi:epoxyqueuosine reductase QueG